MTTASPPPEAPPNPTTPGDRARLLQNVYARALKHALKPISNYANFAACFPTPAQYCESALRDLHADFVRKLGQACEAEFEALLVERDVVRSLNELDALCEEARKRKAKSGKGEKEGDGKAEGGVAPHLMAPEELLRVHLREFVGEQGSILEGRLGSVQEENARLAEEVKRQREEIDALLGGLVGVVRDLEGANEALRGREMEGVGELVRG